MPKKIAIIACAMGLPGEKGYTRFSYLADFLTEKGYEVDLYTSSFNHWEKAQRDKNKIRAITKKLRYKVFLAKEPGYKKNVDIRRIFSHMLLARNITKLLGNNHSKKEYDLLYCVIPDNALAAAVSTFGKKNNIPVIIDIEDLWPEGMERLLHIPPLFSSIVFWPFRHSAKTAYKNAVAYIGTSDEFRDEPLKYGEFQKKPRKTVYVGCDLDTFDGGVAANRKEIAKGADEFWVIYSGTLGSSYDIETLIRAAQEIKRLGHEDIKFLILGDGPLRSRFEETAKEKKCNVSFLGYTEYEKMAAYLALSDVTVNSFVREAPQSIVNKVGDYLAAGKPMINTLSSREFREKVVRENFGLNVWGGDTDALVDAIMTLYSDKKKRSVMGKNARAIAEEQFDRKNSYLAIVDLIKELSE